jgi:hypothetical protein
LRGELTRPYNYSKTFVEFKALFQNTLLGDEKQIANMVIGFMCYHLAGFDTNPLL